MKITAYKDRYLVVRESVPYMLELYKQSHTWFPIEPSPRRHVSYAVEEATESLYRLIEAAAIAAFSDDTW